MNYLIKSQITNMIAIAKTFDQSCKMSTIMDDGKPDKAEAKLLQKITNATTQYIKELEKLKGTDGFLDVGEILKLFKKKAA
ncbi:hypothetical protein [Intestinimonas massiliensis (ex Afouda et al. 2020)]|uniref:hypothetical protein n=1 Tax=Intestinimonas massiliensis (ex Afouda et al. 2020) TaxID=1673721 RepID=UPI001030BB71|nr:hypothetical protein [Intestinimonas massiliensis (ex Afouda et al. 2020)]